MKRVTILIVLFCVAIAASSAGRAEASWLSSTFGEVDKIISPILEDTWRRVGLIKKEDSNNKKQNQCVDEGTKDAIEVVKSAETPQDKQAVADRYNLTGIGLDIWNQFGVLTLNRNDNFSQGDLWQINNVLGAFPADRLRNLYVIAMYEYKGSGYRGMAFPEGVININIHAEDTDQFTRDRWGIANEKANIFTKHLFHEIAHMLDYGATDKQRDAICSLHEASGNDPDNFARYYGMGDAGEDFATMVEAWAADSEGLLNIAVERADNGKSILLRKTLLVADFFAYMGDDGQEYTYMLKIDEIGNITQVEAPIERDASGTIISINGTSTII